MDKETKLQLLAELKDPSLKMGRILNEKLINDAVSKINLAKGEKGDKGDTGDVGLKGDKGDKGEDGKDGKDGRGFDGRDGENGKDGKDGKPGKDGRDGRDADPTAITDTVVNTLKTRKIQDISDVSDLVEFLKRGGYRGGGSSGGGTSGVTTFNTRNGNVTLMSSDVTTALGYTPQVPITLTTTGSSGSATFNGTILNIPQYTSSTGTVTSVATDATLTGGPITTTGTLGLNLANPNTWAGAQTFSGGTLILGGAGSGTTTLTYSNTGSTGGSYLLPPQTASQTLAILGTQTFTGVETFSNTVNFTGTSVNLGNSNATGTYQLGYGALSSGNTKTMNIGTGGLSGSTTNISIGSSFGTTVTFNNLATGILKTTAGVLANATAGTDYLASVNVNSTLTGAGTTGSALGINLSTANTWVGAQTFSSPVITGPGAGVATLTYANTASNGTFTFPNTAGGTLVTTAGVQTLTSKTLTSPVLTTPTLGVATATSIAIGGATALDALDVTGSTYTSQFLGVNVPIATLVSNTWTAAFQSPASTQNVISLLRPTNTVSTLLQFVPFGANSTTNVNWFMGMFANSDSFSFGTYDGSTSITRFAISDTGNLTISGNLSLNTAGNKISIATGSNASVGTATLVGGTVTVSTTAVTANSKIFLTDATTGALTNVGSPTVGTIVAGTSFVINSTNVLDASNINWFIIN